MNWARVRAVITRELLEVRQNRTLLLTIFLPPLLLTFLPLGVMALMNVAPERSNIRPEDIPGTGAQGMPARCQCAAVAMRSLMRSWWSRQSEP